MQSITQASTIDFDRRPNEVFQRAAWALILVSGMLFLIWKVTEAIVILAEGPRRYLWVTLPLAAFIMLIVYLLITIARTFRRLFADRYLPLVTLDAAGVTLNRINPITVPWSEITGADLEPGYRNSTTLLRLQMRDPAVIEAGKVGRIIDLRALAREPAELLAAIQSHPAFEPVS